MVRGALILISILFTSLQGSVGYVTSGMITGITVMIIGIVSAVLTEETFHKDLNYVEE
jgi:VIT1/CCC1 family predicted Fe2+/Mn2+ transporter